MSSTESQQPDEIQRVVIAGGGLAGAKTAEALRDAGYTGEIVLFAAEKHLPYERPPLSKGYLKGEQTFEDTLVLPAEWYPEHDVDLRTGTAVTSVDAAAHEVAASDGSTTHYDRLVIAAGASPRRIDLPGADLPGVRYLRTVEDADALKAAFTPGARVVVIGGGWIGLEGAAAAREAGADVVLLESQGGPLLTVVGSDLSESFAELHREHGVDLRTGVRIEEIVPADDSHRVGGVRLSGGEVVPADVVLVGIGAAPNLDLATSAGVDVDNGIVADAQGGTSDPDIFAIGDLADADTPRFGERLRVEHWANALDRPPSVARGVLGQDGGFDKLPFFYSDQYDLGLEYSGRLGDGNTLVIRGDLEGREYVAFWLDDADRVRAGMNVNVWDVQDDIQSLIAERTPVDRAKLADPDVPLTEVGA